MIGVHVRRGDMLATPSAVPAAWYAPAVALLRAKLNAVGQSLSVRVWSDDPAWCAQTLDLGEPFEVAPRAPAMTDLGAVSYTHLTLPTTPYV